MSVTEIEGLQQNVRQLELQISRLKESNRRSFEENDILKDEIKNSSSNLSKLQTELRGTRSELSTFKQKEITIHIFQAKFCAGYQSSNRPNSRGVGHELSFFYWPKT